MNLHHKARKVLFCGRSGTGKTTAWRQYVLRYRCRALFVFDPELEFHRTTGAAVGSDVKELLALLAARRPVVFDPAKHFAGRMPEGFAFFAQWCFAVAQQFDGVKLFACDEVQKFQKVGMGGVPASVIEMMDTGRRQEFDTAFCCKGVNKLNDDIRGQLTEIYAFRHSDRLQLQWLESEGFDPEKVKALPMPGVALWHNLDNGEEKLVRFSASHPTGKRGH